MATLRKTILMLTSAGALAVGMASFAYAGGLSHGDVADDEFLQQLQSTEPGGGGFGGGANLALPGQMTVGGSMIQCGDVAANPARFASNIVGYCRTHTR